MHGSMGGRKAERRYYCSRRKQDGSCDQPIVKAEPLEEALAGYVRGFSPPHEVRLVRSFAGGRRSPGLASPSAIARRISAATCW